MRYLAPFLLLVGCSGLSADGAGTTPTTPAGGGGPGGGPADCPPLDAFDNEAEHGPGLGDACEQGVPLIAPIADDGASDVMEGNAHLAGDVDWWVIEAVDRGGDEARGYEDFHLQVRLVEGADVYHFYVVKGLCTDPEACVPEDVGYDEFSFFQHDTTPDPITGDYPADRRACGAPPREECTDYTDTFLVRVSTISGEASCAPYRLEVDNGVW